MPFGHRVEPGSQAERDMFVELSRQGYLDPGIGPLTVGGGKKWEVFNPMTGEVLQTVGSESTAKRLVDAWRSRILRAEGGLGGQHGNVVADTAIPDYARKGVGWVKEDEGMGIFKRIGMNLEWMLRERR